MTRETAEFAKQLEQMRSHPGFIAALDQSGGGTPPPPRADGHPGDTWAHEEEKVSVVPPMGTRLLTNPALPRGRILRALLFQNTIDRGVEGRPTPAHP